MQKFKMFKGQLAFKFYPGIELDFYEEYYHSVIHYHLKSVRYFVQLFFSMWIQ